MSHSASVGASVCALSVRVCAKQRGHGCEPRLSRRSLFRPRACAVAVLASAPRPTAVAVASASVSLVPSSAPAPAPSTAPVALSDTAGLSAASGRARLHSSSPSPPAAVRFRPAPARHNAACAAPASAASAPAASKSLIAADCTANIHTVQLQPRLERGAVATSSSTTTQQCACEEVGAVRRGYDPKNRGRPTPSAAGSASAANPSPARSSVTLTCGDAASTPPTLQGFPYVCLEVKMSFFDQNYTGTLPRMVGVDEESGELQYEKKQSRPPSGLHAPLKVLGSSCAHGVCARACMGRSRVKQQACHKLFAHRRRRCRDSSGLEEGGTGRGRGFSRRSSALDGFFWRRRRPRHVPRPLSLTRSARGSPWPCAIAGLQAIAHGQTHVLALTAVDGGSGLRRVRSRCECGCMQRQEQAPARP